MSFERSNHFVILPEGAAAAVGVGGVIKEVWKLPLESVRRLECVAHTEINGEDGKEGDGGREARKDAQILAKNGCRSLP